MPIFLDTGNLVEIERFHRMGIIRGVTTNPTILFHDGVRGGMRGIEERAKQIAKLIAPWPVSVEVTTNDPLQTMRQAQTIAGWADNILVKVTIHGPAGELENLEIVHQLETKHNIRVNVTAMMSAQQCFLAALAGATYVSIFGGRVNNMGYNGSLPLLPGKPQDLLQVVGLSGDGEKHPVIVTPVENSRLIEGAIGAEIPYPLASGHPLAAGLQKGHRPRPSRDITIPKLIVED